jgi:uncharacterized protein YecT (DUF1311 family)
VRKACERVPRRVATVAAGLACLLLASTLLGAQPEGEPDPCAHAYGPDLNPCWAREAQRAEEEMTRVYLTLRGRLPDRAAESLEKAQELWLEFRQAHLRTIYGVEDPRRTWGLDYPICLSMSRVALTRARTRELLRILEPDEQSLCPL